MPAAEQHQTHRFGNSPVATGAARYSGGRAKGRPGPSHASADLTSAASAAAGVVAAVTARVARAGADLAAAALRALLGVLPGVEERALAGGLHRLAWAACDGLGRGHESPYIVPSASGSASAGWPCRRARTSADMMPSSACVSASRNFLPSHRKM